MTHSRHPVLLVIFRILFTFGLCWTIWFIFSNSMTVATVSSQQSVRVMNFLNHYLQLLHLPTLTEHMVRKMAHFAEYALLGFFAQMCLRVYTARFVRHISWPLFFGLLTAVADETVQLFYTGRSSQITDVWIDFGGCFCGVFAALMLLLVCRLIALTLFAGNEADAVK